MFEFFVSGLRAGLRGRSFQVVFLLGLLLMGLAYLSGSFSPRQPQTVALDVGLSGIRFTLVILSLFWAQELIAREIDRKTILFSLAYPVSRGQFILGRYFAIVVLVAIAALVFGLALLVAVVFASGMYLQEFPVMLGTPYWATLAGLVLDTATVAAVATCIAALSTVAIMPVAIGGAFAIAGKSLGATFDYLTHGADGDIALQKTYTPLIHTVRWIVPDLSRLDWRDWPMYGLAPTTDSLMWGFLMAASYLILCLTLAVLAFSRREFA